MSNFYYYRKMFFVRKHVTDVYSPAMFDNLNNTLVGKMMDIVVSFIFNRKIIFIYPN